MLIIRPVLKIKPALLHIKCTVLQYAGHCCCGYIIDKHVDEITVANDFMNWVLAIATC